jgi:hypothetical protein
MKKYNIGLSELTNNVYIGKTNKKNTEWLDKENISDEFDIIAIQKYKDKPCKVETSIGTFIISVIKEKK